MSNPHNSQSDDASQQASTGLIAGTPQIADGDSLEPSHTHLQSQKSAGRSVEPERAHGSILPSEITSSAAHKDTSSSTSSSIAKEGRIRRSDESSPTHSSKVKGSVSVVQDDIESRHDVELSEPLEKTSTPRQPADENLVNWDVDDPGNPKTWSARMKWTCVAIVSVFTFISPVSSSMTARKFRLKLPICVRTTCSARLEIFPCIALSP